MKKYIVISLQVLAGIVVLVAFVITVKYSLRADDRMERIRTENFRAQGYNIPYE